MDRFSTMTLTLVEQTLPELANEINREHQLCTDAIGDMVQHAIHAGELLIEAKGKCQHGEWLDWIEKNCSFSYRTAANYMRVFNRRADLDSNVQRVAHLRDAIELLAEPKGKASELFEAVIRPIELLPGATVHNPAGSYRELNNGVKQCEKCGELWAADLPYCPYCHVSPEARIAFVHQQESTPHVSFNSGNNEWYTPLEYIEAARRVMGEIDLDPASSAIANETVGATVYFTSEDDGLRYSWDGRVWMNPPYASELIGLFTNKLASQYQAGDVTEAIVLVNNATETNWFQAILTCASAVCLVKGRIKFIDMDGNPSGAPLQGQAILYLGDKPDVFAEIFNEFGAVLYGHRTRRNQK